MGQLASLPPPYFGPGWFAEADVVAACIGQLDLVARHTAMATNAILDECENIEREVAGFSAQSATTAATARIYQACSFHDVTGQMMAKVVQMLKLMEVRMAGRMPAFGPQSAGAQVAAGPVTLLNGPQAPQHAMTQAAVDALLGGVE